MAARRAEARSTGSSGSATGAMEDEQALAARASVARLDEITDEILGTARGSRARRAVGPRGMVVGQVQSGKTQLHRPDLQGGRRRLQVIVVLAGMHNSLRSQTQLRLDEGFLGSTRSRSAASTRRNRRIGVGRLPGTSSCSPVNSLTNSEEKGDFNLRVARQVGMHDRLGPGPARRQEERDDPAQPDQVGHELNQHEHPETGRHGRAGRSASGDRRRGRQRLGQHQGDPARRERRPDEDADPTAINGLIRELLHQFEQTRVRRLHGDAVREHLHLRGRAAARAYGEDLFPRSFILRLPPPVELHRARPRSSGSRRMRRPGSRSVEPLPIVRDVVGRRRRGFAPRHKKDW